MNPKLHAARMGAVLASLLTLGADMASAESGVFGWGAAPPAAHSPAKPQGPAQRNEPTSAAKASAAKPPLAPAPRRADAAHSITPAAPAAAPHSATPATASHNATALPSTASTSSALTAPVGATQAPPAVDPPAEAETAADAARQAAQEWKRRREALLNNQPTAP